MKIWLSGKRFSSNEEVNAERNTYFAEFRKSYLEGLKKLENHWTKCIDLKGSCGEKLIQFLYEKIIIS